MKYLNTFSLFNENKQLSQKLYLSTGKISQEDYDKILEITGGEVLDKLYEPSFGCLKGYYRLREKILKK